MLREESDYFIQEIFKKEIAKVMYAIENASTGHYAKSYETWKRTQNIIKCFAKELKNKEKESQIRVLDIGCANGLNIFLLNSLFGLKRRVYFDGIDLSPAEIYLAKRIKKALDLDNVTFEVGNAQDLKFPSLYFDIVIFAEVIEHIVNPNNCLAEISRVLKHGGSAIITTPNKINAFRKLKNIFYFFIASKETNSGYGLKEQLEIPRPHVSLKDLPEWVDIIEQNGFKIESIKRGSLFFGGRKYDEHPLFFSFSLVLDTILNHLPFALNFTESITFKLRKPKSFR